MISMLLLLCSQPSEPLLSLEKGALTRIELYLPEETVILERRGTQWLLPDWQNYPAEVAFAESLVRILEGFPLGTVVPTDAVEAGLEPPLRRIRMFGKANKLLGELWVGNPLANYAACTVALPEAEEIRRVDVPLLPALMRPTWGSRTVWRLKPDLIREITLHDLETGRTVTIDHEDTDLLEMLSHLRAADVRHQPGKRESADLRLRVGTPHVDLVLAIRFLEDGTCIGWSSRESIVYHFSGRFPEWLLEP